MGAAAGDQLASAGLKVASFDDLYGVMHLECRHRDAADDEIGV